ncbi:MULTISPECIES: MBL fold metallo-hydrolase [Flammeovirga]|uniref:MBL fold metallo-hydrolase n=1 Tax=Flammeovirga agarivorans TaxID=2726742 RepID=A0A7X8XUH3_9BACT|nr:MULTISPECIES: MBL fold metallo-hydrolase [Flammeovirga]NLR90125.1 hypothetical protein [Flammeovirga agarivorans]
MINLQRLNMDNSWFLEFDGLRILVDPWLEGTEVDFFTWFNTQWHRTAPVPYNELPAFDVVLITQKYPDHFHHQTLEKLQPKLVIGPDSIQKDLMKLLPNTEFHALNKKQTKVNVKGIDVHFLPTRRWIDPIYDAIVLSNGNESVYFMTHGFTLDQAHQEQLKEVGDCSLLVTPFNLYKLPFFLGGVVSPGIKGVEHLCETIQPKVVVPTHDEDKYAKGIVSKFAKIKRATPKELNKYTWLKDRYQAFSDYKLSSIS